MQLLGHGNPSMKLPLHSFSANINASASLELFSYGISRALVTFTYHEPQHSVTRSEIFAVFRFMAEFLNASTLIIHNYTAYS